MAQTKFGGYIITQTKPNYIPEFFGPRPENVESLEMGYIDDSVIKGSFYCETCWFLKGGEQTPGRSPHVHDFDEILGFYGSNPEDPHDLCGEVVQYLGDEKHIITKSCLIFIPKGLKHGPLNIRRVDRPIFHFATGKTSLYHGQKV